MIFNSKGISLFLAVVLICFSHIRPSFALTEGSNANPQKIKFNGQILHMQVCNGDALVSVRKDNSNFDSTLFRIDLKKFTVKQLMLPEMRNADVDYFDCDETNGNYFLIDEKIVLNPTEDPIVLAYSATPSDHLLWKFTFDSTYIHPQIEDLIVAQSKNMVLVRIFHLRIPDQNGNRKEIPDDIYALNKTNGKIIWQLSLAEIQDRNPAINIIDDTFYLTYAGGHIDAYDINTGVLKWKFKGKYPERYFPPQLDAISKTLITACDSNSVYQTVEIIGIDMQTGQLRWQVPVKSWVKIPLNLSETLTADSRILIYSRSEEAYVDINWLELPINGDNPIYLHQWRSGYDEKRGGVRLITGVNKYFTLINFDDRQTYVFDQDGFKRDDVDLTSLPKQVLMLKTFNGFILYAGLDGEVGLFKLHFRKNNRSGNLDNYSRK